MGNRLKGTCAVCLCVTMLAGCGTTPGDRGLSGGLLGAGTGAAIGSLAGSAGTGALIGGLGGVAIGVLTSPAVLDLGRPAWRSASYHHHRKHARRVARNDSGCSTRETETKRITTCPR